MTVICLAGQNWDIEAGYTLDHYLAYSTQLTSTQKDHQKHNNPEKQCDTWHMDTFACQGWLTINIEDINTNTYTAIWIVHKMNHVPYEWVEVPTDILYENCLRSMTLKPLKMLVCVMICNTHWNLLDLFPQSWILWQVTREDRSKQTPNQATESGMLSWSATHIGTCWTYSHGPGSYDESQEKKDHNKCPIRQPRVGCKHKSAYVCAPTYLVTTFIYTWPALDSHPVWKLTKILETLIILPNLIERTCGAWHTQLCPSLTNSNKCPNPQRL